ncbi:hypothetical protein MHY85_13325 [Cellulomonas sp. ACRRI]|uniref:hypothetical protein n=1 Tax=Cellulomonas sp. ACRRI TaxID=2918188 RepID=UPI001EF3B724|nr:hypothetical protein [Cellulomonas sp. ACRRI]MCG7286951.1 hypothetical protein [Cellulomonas sp. ACRRI]
MTELTVNHSAVTAAGGGIRTAAQLMPGPGWGPSCASGSPAVDAALASLSVTVGEQLLGAAAEMFRLGQGAVSAVDVYRTTDAAL